jgi:hypothetical protein
MLARKHHSHGAVSHCDNIRLGSGRKRYDPVHRSARLNCVLSPALMAELKRREAKVGLYHTEIARIVLTDVLIGGVVQR